MTLVEHLAELRSRLDQVASSPWPSAACIGFLLYNRVLESLVEPYCDVKPTVDADSTLPGCVVVPTRSRRSPSG